MHIKEIKEIGGFTCAIGNDNSFWVLEVGVESQPMEPGKIYIAKEYLYWRELKIGDRKPQPQYNSLTNDATDARKSVAE